MARNKTGSEGADCVESAWAGGMRKRATKHNNNKDLQMGMMKLSLP
jgi:hypothetical protein